MAKITTRNTLVELESGRFGFSVLAKLRKKTKTIRHVYTDQKQSALQTAWREKYTIADQAWINADEATKNLRRPPVWKRAFSNYAHYMQVNLSRLRAGLPITMTPP